MTDQGENGQDGLQALLGQFEKFLGIDTGAPVQSGASFEGLVDAYDRLAKGGVPVEAMSELAPHKEPDWVTGCWSTALGRISSTLRANCWRNGKVIYQLPKEFTTYLLIARTREAGDVPYSDVMLDSTVGEKERELERIPFFQNLIRLRFWEVARRTYPQLVMSVKADFYHMPKYSEPHKPVYQITLQIAPHMGGTNFARTVLLRFEEDSTSLDIPMSSPCVTIDSKTQWAAAVRKGRNLEHLLPTGAPEGYVAECTKRLYTELVERNTTDFNPDAILEHYEASDQRFLDRVMGRSRKEYEELVQPVTELTGADWRNLFDGRTSQRRMPTHYPVDSDMLWSDPAALAVPLKEHMAQTATSRSPNT